MSCATPAQKARAPSAGPQAEKYSATVQWGSGAGERLVPVIITIRGYTADEEAWRMVEVLRSQGSGALLDAVRVSEGKGTFTPTGRLSQELKLVRSIPTPRGRQVRVVLDRPIGFLEGLIGAKSLSYPFGIIVMNLDASGVGEGQVLGAARISFDQNNELVIERFDVEPATLRNIRPMLD